MSVDGSSSVSGAPVAAADLHRECFAGEAAAGGAAREQRRCVGAVQDWEPLAVSACSFKQNSSCKCAASGDSLVKLQRRLLKNTH